MSDDLRRAREAQLGDNLANRFRALVHYPLDDSISRTLREVLSDYIDAKIALAAQAGERTAPASDPAKVPEPGSALSRWGVCGRGCVKMKDGYWTPWHTADAALATAQRERDEAVKKARILDRMWVHAEGEVDALKTECSRLADRALPDDGREYICFTRAQVDAINKAATELTAVRGRMAEAVAQTRRYAGHYAEGSDGRNTFTILAEWMEKHLLTDPAPERAEGATRAPLTEATLRELAKERGWYAREGTSVPQVDGSWRHPFTVIIDSRALLDLVNTSNTDPAREAAIKALDHSVEAAVTDLGHALEYAARPVSTDMRARVANVFTYLKSALATARSVGLPGADKDGGAT